MITIGYNQVQEKHVTDGSGAATEAKKVYVGNKLAHVHVNDNTEFALRQTLNGYIHEDNDLHAKIRSIRGNTKVWNQLVQNPTFVDDSGWNAVNGTGTASNNEFNFVVGPESLSAARIQTTLNVIANHVYLFVYNIYSDKDTTTRWGVTYSGRFGDNQQVPAGVWTKYAMIRTIDRSGSIQFYLYNNIQGDLTTGDTVKYRNVNLYDLTLIYGAGNEPTTVAEFEADFQQWFGRPIGAEPYDAGSLIPFQATGIKSTGFNLWDEEWEVGTLAWSTGENSPSSTEIRSKNYISCSANKEYYIKVGGDDNIRVYAFFYDAGKTMISHIGSSIKNTVFTTPTNAKYIRFRTTNLYGTTYNNDICINLSNPTLNGTYVPYKATTVPIPVTTLTGKAEGSTTSEVIFPDGMKSAGSVKDEVYVENGKTYAVKRVGSVDLGSLDFYKSTNTNGIVFYYAENSLQRHVANMNIYTCAKYVWDRSYAYSNATTYESTISTMSNGISPSIVPEKEYADTASFKAAMSGVMLYYELATPIVYEVDNYTLPLHYTANGTGTEELQSTTTTAPADMDIEYRLLEEEWYGIRWRMADDAWVSPVRIGNPRLHQELPIQSMMKRCALVNGVPKFISESNVDEYEDGTAVDYANTDIYVQIPEYYFEATKDDDGWCELKIHTKVKVGTKSRLYYEGAWLATLDNNVLGSKSYINFSAIGSPTDGTYNAALFKNATNFVANTPYGGNGSTTYDDTEGCNIGRPKTSTTIANFRTYAQNNSNRHGIVNYDCWCSIMRLFMVEFCSFYSQAAIDDTLTVHKFRQGGLSAGVTSGLTSWSNFNGYNPLIPCGFTKSLGNRTGVIKMHYAAEGAQTSAVNISVPSYRGIEEPFGDIYNIVDGIAIYGDGADTQKASIYVATAATIDNNAYVTPSGTNAAPTGYELLTDDAPYKEESDSETSGYIKVWHWDEHGMFAPLKTGGNSSTVGLTDYMYMYNDTGWRLLLAGGRADFGGNAGLGCFGGVGGFGGFGASVGSRLLYTPAS